MTAMKLGFANTLEFRLLLALTSGLLLFSSVAGFITYRHAYQLEREQSMDLQQHLVETVQEQAEVAAFANNEAIARGVIKGLLANPQVIAVRIESTDGFRVAQVPEKIAAQSSATAYPLYSPIQRNETIGTLEVVQNDAYVDSRARSRALQQTLLMLGQMLVAVMLLSAVLRIMLVKPIVRMAQAMRALSPGSAERLNLDATGTMEELRLLAGSVNALLDAEERALQDVRQSEERFSLAFHASPLAFSVARASDGRFIDVNNNYERDFGWSPSDLIGHTALEIGLWPDEKARRPWLDRLILEGRVIGWETTWRHKHGSLRQVSISSEIVHIQGQTFILDQVIDITERKRIETEINAARIEAENANQAKTRFLAAASHDLRQPIQAINLFHSALDRSALNAEQKRISQHLAMSVTALSELLNALLDISKLDAGVVTPVPSVIHVDTLFARIDAEFSGLAAAKSLRFLLRFPLAPMAIVSDIRLLMSLLGNLIGNAIKYTTAGGVLVSIRRRDDQALIQVWDTGIGMAAHDLEHIFEEYFQIGNPERDRTKGLGLGLSIAKRQASLLNTKITCLSLQGQGSVFEFRVPLANPSAEDAYPAMEGPACAELEYSPASGRHAVIIEDDALVSHGLKLAFEANGLRVTTFASAEEALEQIDLDAVDVIVTDYRLPGIDGQTLLDRLQERSQTPLTGIILTGETSPERIKKAKASGWTLLFKPVDLDTLLASLQLHSHSSRN
jgi:PAS domain S-box-containing protein